MTVKDATIICIVRCKAQLEAFNQGGTTVHELQMCHVLLENVQWPIDKLSRWLGYIQGYIIAKGYSTVAIERAFSRPLFHEAYKNEGIEIPKTLDILNQSGYNNKEQNLEE